MSRTNPKRIKTLRESTAAYAASQPLFDALRTGVRATDDQHSLLNKARDTVQQTHIKLADSISDSETNLQATYTHPVIKAWQSATESFANIFGALAEATAAEPSQGKAAKEGHDAFVKMAALAQQANTTAQEFDLQGNGSDVSSTKAEAGASESTSEAAPNKHATESTQNSTNPALAQVPTSKEARKAAKKARKVESKRQEHEKKMLALRAKARSKSGPQNGKLSPKPAPVTASVSTPTAGGVEYEDVSAEVEARLKAKEDMRDAAKKEKKRKRDSGESFGTDVAEKKPLKKKSRAEEGEVMAVKEPKRKTGEGEDGGGRKKARVKG